MSGELAIDVGDDDGYFVAHFEESELPMPPGCLLQLAPLGRLVVRLFDDGRVEFGDGVEPDVAAREFWDWLSVYVGAR